jgi:S-adenosylmethionine:tRNA ribosyltransferase-isomerase
MIKIDDLNYRLPESLIAQSPANPRDSSKLMTVNRESHEINHYIFHDLTNLLTNNDVLVFNDTKVFPARLIGTKDTGGKVEILLLKELRKGIWEAIHKGSLHENAEILFRKLQAKVLKVKEQLVELDFTPKDNFQYLLNQEGYTPLPPYIESSKSENEIRNLYQTVYANNLGSAAAPTAGFHFTKELLNKLQNKGIQIEYVTLHVGLGTFLPIKEDIIEKHQIHREWYSLDEDTANNLNLAKIKGKRIITVGTTTTRVLETCCIRNGELTAQEGETGIYIYPPYKFKFVDALITNFHLPKSTLLALVSSFVSFPNTYDNFSNFENSLIGKAYKQAIDTNYRFYSFGDSMLII